MVILVSVKTQNLFSKIAESPTAELSALERRSFVAKESREHRKPKTFLLLSLRATKEEPNNELSPPQFTDREIWKPTQICQEAVRTFAILCRVKYFLLIVGFLFYTSSSSS